MRAWVIAAALAVAAQSGAVALAPGPVPGKARWCDGAYDPKRGTNFASCESQEERLSEIQAPGDADGGK